MYSRRRGWGIRSIARGPRGRQMPPRGNNPPRQRTGFPSARWRREARGYYALRQRRFHRAFVMNPNPSTQRTAVLLLARELHLGGSERQMAEIAQVLGSHGFEAHIGCFHTGGLRYDQLRNAGLRVIQFKIHSYASTGAVTGIIDLVRYVRSQKIRIVHAWDYPTAVSSIPVTRLFTRAVAISSQRGHRELIPDRYRALARMSDRFSRAIVVNCEFL